MPKLSGDCGSISFDGVQYERGPDGLFDVPQEAVRPLLEMGLRPFVPAEPPRQPEPQPEPEPVKAPQPAPEKPRRRRR